MSHKAFISYKHSDAQDLRDCIIRRLGKDAVYYRGETSESPYSPDGKTARIRMNLIDMLDDTSVMIVIVSPNMLQSRWMECEIKYALREHSRGGSILPIKGIVCVVQKDERYFSSNPYAWAKYNGKWSSWKLFNILQNNRYNRIISNQNLSQNYIDIVTEDDFLRQPSKYIEEAFYKSQNLYCYEISDNGEERL